MPLTGSPTTPQNKLSWPWVKLLGFFIAGLLCFIVLTFPFNNSLNLFIDEPQLLKTLNSQQQADYLSRLEKHISPTTQTINVNTPEGSLSLTKDSLPQLFQHTFNSAISIEQNPIENHDLYTGHSFQHENQLPFITGVHLNTHGIYGLCKVKNKLHLAIWADSNTKELNLHYNNKVIPVTLNRWVSIELPADAMNHQLRLEPLDNYALDNFISLKNYSPQPLQWTSDHELQQEFKTYLNEQVLWRSHPSLFISKNKSQPIPDTKHLNFIDESLPGLSRISKLQASKNLYSTAYLSLSSRHHSLEWALSKPPILSLRHETYHPLWFQDNEVYANINSTKTHLNTTLVFNEFSYGLNNKAFELSILSLYPNLEDPWLIKRNQLEFHAYENLMIKKANEFHPVWMALCLLASSLIILLSLRESNDQ